MAGVGAYLDVEHVGKLFTRPARRGAAGEQSIRVLTDVSFSARLGEFVSVIGPSGCGKTTLLRCLAGLIAYDEGDIRLDAQRVEGPGPERAVVFQHACLLPWRSLERNVAYGLELRRELPKAEIRRRVRDALDLVGLSKFAAHYPHEISGGMQQRANLARALVVEPKLVLMDEPFGALDAMTKASLQEELLSLAQIFERTTVFITHDIEEAVFLGDTVIMMSAATGSIAHRFEVPFARPRSADLKTSTGFLEAVNEVRARVQELKASSGDGP